MGRYIDISGEQYGRLTPVVYTGGSNWICECSCGNFVEVRTNKLRSGNTKSCKCYRNTLLAEERRLGSGTAAFGELYRRYAKTARVRNYVFELSKEEVMELATDDCYYCGQPPSQVVNHRDCFGTFTYNGIDRLDNTIGYVSDNVVTCCKTCNYAKNTLHINDFREWVKRISDRELKGHW